MELIGEAPRGKIEGFKWKHGRYRNPHETPTDETIMSEMRNQWKMRHNTRKDEHFMCGKSNRVN